MLPISDEQRRALAAVFEKSLVRGARDRSPGFAVALLGYVVSDLRTGAPLSDEVRQYLADALELAAASPTKAGVALGLIPKRSRPKGDLFSERNRTIVRMLELLRDQGFPPHGNRQGNSTFAAVGNVVGVSEHTVSRVWIAHNKATAEMRALRSPAKKLVD
jgi:hypothetical protein